MTALVDVSSITKVAKDDLGLQAQPKVPKYRTALAQIYVRSQPYGGSDKSSNGHRYDSIPFANGMISAGMSCQLIHYTHQEHDRFFEVCKNFDAIIVRCNPGQIKADGGDQQKFDDGMRALRKLGIQVWPSPDVMEFMGAKDALCKVANLNIGLPDTLAYYDPSEFAAGFKKTMAFQPRVLKQNRGSSGEGIWIIKLKAGNYCKSYGERSCEDNEILDLMEANDNHSEEHTVAELIEFCVNGRTSKSGEWTSKGVGKYLEGGKAAGGQLVDQRFCPRIVEGELRYNMVGDALVGIIHKKPKEGGISAVGGTGSIYTYYGPEETKFKALTDNFLKRDLEHVMPALGLDEPIPLWWTTDFILASPEGTPADQEKWIVGEFNCSCVGISKCLAAYCKDDTPNASYNDISPEDLKAAQGYGDIMGQKALGILDKAANGPVDVSSLTKVAKDNMGLRPQPPNPMFRTALAQIYVRNQPYGGSDKSSNGHRYDSIPFANGMISAGMSCQLIHYTHQEHDKFFEVCKSFHAIIVRCNPGQIKADGGDQQKFDDGMRVMRRLGIQVWPSPDVMEFMGAKDALCKVANLNIGLPDTLAYYDPDEFAAGFKKTMAFQPRVLKQNRGSSGEGIWIIKLKAGNYCSSYGERSCDDSEVLDLMEANDNHSETHTVAELIEFCVNGRNSRSGEWTSKGVGKYLEGGKAAGGQLVDQRFCPRIVEGELRYNMVGDALVGIIHKKPKEGGISAVGGTGSIYTYYGPEEPKFMNLTENFLKRDLEHVMPSLGLGDEPVPLWWTTDFILASPEGTPADQEKWIVGEFNCSCVGISKCLPAYCKDDTPNANYFDIPPEDLMVADSYGNLMGVKAKGILDQMQCPVDVSSLKCVAKDNCGLKAQPTKPIYKSALAQIYVRSQPYGGSDKSSNGHRYDSIPFANGMISAGISCQLIHYTHEEHEKFFDVCKNFDAIIVRCNPGQIKADGGSQQKFDDGMRNMRKLGIQVWPSPDVMEFMGAKDALCKVANLNIGLPDTLAYYDPAEFAAGFKKTMAFQPRVLKQNRGSSGEGIWIIKLKSGNYCKTFGERSCTDDEVLDLMEANDNHSEQHTVAELIEFCVYGRTAKSGSWTSKGVGKYLEGGKAAGGQLVDQRFCPRIVEGELRYNMVGDALVGIIHKKPKEGGISAVGGTGSIYTYYGPEEPKFKALTENFLKRDLVHVMPSLGLGMEPLPLWWTTDFILSSPEGTPTDQEKWIVGEFNCSCVGISRCLAAYCKADTPNASFLDISVEDLKEATRYGDIMGEKAMNILNKARSPVDVSSISKVAKDDLGLLAQPKLPKYKTCVAQIFVRSQPYGGSDKSSNGHRYDTIPFANGMICAGMSCQLIHYTHQEHDKFFEVCKNFDAIIVRCNPGQIKADGGDQQKFDDGMRAMRKLGIQVWPSPDVMEFMGAKDALCKVADLNIGLPDTLAYYDPADFAAGFKKTMAFQPRVLKQNRGSSGEGIWIIKLKSGNYCSSYGERSCTDDEVLDLMEANDNHSETHTVAELLEFCVNGRTNKSGEWTSKGVGKYLEGGKAAGGQLVDQRFCPRIVEGELRYNMVGDALVGIIHKKPKEGGISAVGGTGSIYTFYGPEEVKFQNLTTNFLKRDLEFVMPALGLAEEPVPLWWTTDFILASPVGTPSSEEKWIVGEFNCSCVGISKCLAAYCKDDTPNACFYDISTEDLKEASRYGMLMGEKAHGILYKADNPVDVSCLTTVASDYLGLLKQHANPTYKTALAQIYVRSQPYGGSDKSSNGHRYDSIPFANGMINAGMSCQLIHYVHGEHNKFFNVCRKFDAIIVRCNPGQIKADGGDQQKFDDGMRAMRRLGIQVWPSPDVMEFMGAKDALCKVANLNIGLPDTLAYYDPAEFAAGFKKTMAFQPRVLKQNRGSSGEGIWIIKLKSGKYCSSYGERSCTDDEVLDLMEANDNHSETHTVAELIEFCVNGRTGKSGTWTSKGVGKYLEGGKAAGGQLVDQRFCPRIVEGELRYNMVGDALVGIIHKKPKEGGISAVGGTGSIYTFYGPEEVKFKSLTENFLKRDLQYVMPSLGLAEEPIPLWWTTDFILASPVGTPTDQEKWIVGEFNCSCVGISKCLAAYCKDDTPNASYKDIAVADVKEAQRYGDLMGKKARAILSNAKGGLGLRTPGVFKIVFLRHGESDWNVKNIFTGWADVDLSEAGMKEACEAGRMLKDETWRFDIVFTSVLRRAVRTAWTALMESDNFSMPIINTWRLNERHYGGLQGLNKAETAAKHGEKQVKIWRRSYDIPPPAISSTDPRHPCNDPMYRHVPKAALPGAESLAMTVDRVLPFWHDTIAPCVMAGKNVLVSAHGNSLRAIIKYLEGMSEDEVMELNIPTGVPLVYELNSSLEVLDKYYLLDEASVQKKLDAVASQGKAK